MDSLSLDRHSVVPLYYQIQQHLLEDIRSGKLQAGKSLPSEEVISKRLRVSRMTARQALKSLCSLGVAYSQRGKGTFVSEIKLEKNFRQVQSFTEEMEAHGSRPHSKLISSEVLSVPVRRGGSPSSTSCAPRRGHPDPPRACRGRSAHGHRDHVPASVFIPGSAR